MTIHRCGSVGRSPVGTVWPRVESDSTQSEPTTATTTSTAPARKRRQATTTARARSSRRGRARPRRHPARRRTRRELRRRYRHRSRRASGIRPKPWPSELERAMLTSPDRGLVVAITAPPGREVGGGDAAHHAAQPRARRARRGAAQDRARRGSRRPPSSRARSGCTNAGAGALRELEAARAALAVARGRRGGGAAGARGARHRSRSRRSRRSRCARRTAVRSRTLDVSIGEGVEQPVNAWACSRPRAPRWSTSSCRFPAPRRGRPAPTTIVRRGDGKTWSAKVEGLPASLDRRDPPARLPTPTRGGDELPYPGTPLEVRVPLATGIVVPQDAVQQIEGEWGVFVRRRTTQAQVRPHPARPRARRRRHRPRGSRAGPAHRDRRRLPAQGARAQASGGGDEHAH